MVYVDDTKDLLRRMIGIFSATYLNESDWLTVREKDYLIDCILIAERGVDLISGAANNTLRDLGYRNKNLFNYRDKLKKKGWIIQTPMGIVLHPEFDFSNKKLPGKITLRIPLSLPEAV